MARRITNSGMLAPDPEPVTELEHPEPPAHVMAHFRYFFEHRRGRKMPDGEKFVHCRTCGVSWDVPPGAANRQKIDCPDCGDPAMVKTHGKGPELPRDVVVWQDFVSGNGARNFHTIELASMAYDLLIPEEIRREYKMAKNRAEEDPARLEAAEAAVAAAWDQDMPNAPAIVNGVGLNWDVLGKGEERNGFKRFFDLWQDENESPAHGPVRPRNARPGPPVDRHGQEIAASKWNQGGPVERPQGQPDMDNPPGRSGGNGNPSPGQPQG